MNAVILAGGLGTRLYPLTLKRPKSLLPFLDLPLIEYQLQLSREGGCEKTSVAAGHLSSELRNYLVQSDLRLNFVEEDEPLGTGGAVARALREARPEPPVMVLNGDLITDIAPRSLLETHERLNGWLTIVAAEVSAPESFGSLTIDQADTLLAFNEKVENQGGNEPTPVNAGVYMLGEQACAELAARDGAFSLERDFFPQLAQRGLIRAHRHKGFWRDVGTLESYFKTQFDILGYFLTMGTGNFGGVRDDFSLFRDFIYVHNEVSLGDSCDLFHRVILMRGASVGASCYLRNCLVLPGAAIGNNCRLETVIVDSGTTVPDGTEADSRLFCGDRQETFAG